MRDELEFSEGFHHGARHAGSGTDADECLVRDGSPRACDESVGSHRQARVSTDSEQGGPESSRQHQCAPAGALPWGRGNNTHKTIAITITPLSIRYISLSEIIVAWLCTEP